MKLTIPVSDREQKSAARLAKQLGTAVPDLVRELLSSRAKQRLNEIRAKKASPPVAKQLSLSS